MGSREQDPPPVGVALDRINAVTRDVQREIARALAESGDHGLRPSFAPLLQLVSGGPMPVGRLAEQLGISAQAASKAAAALVELGYLERATCAEDRRSKPLGLTSRGRRLIQLAGDTLLDREESYAGLIGRAGINRVLRDVDDLCRGLGLRQVGGPVLRFGSGRSVGELVLIALYAKDAVIGATVDRSSAGVRTCHIELLTTMGSTGGRVSDLARATCQPPGDQRHSTGPGKARLRATSLRRQRRTRRRPEDDGTRQGACRQRFGCHLGSRIALR